MIVNACNKEIADQRSKQNRQRSNLKVKKGKKQKSKSLRIYDKANFAILLNAAYSFARSYIESDGETDAKIGSKIIVPSANAR